MALPPPARARALLLACCCIIMMTMHVQVAATSMRHMHGQINGAGSTGSRSGSLVPSSVGQQRRLLQSSDDAAQSFTLATFTYVPAAGLEAPAAQTDVREFQDTFWTFPQYEQSGATAARNKPVPGEAHYLSIDMEVDPTRLQGDDVLQLFEGDGTLRGALLRQWTGRLLQPSAIVTEALQQVAGDDDDDPDEVEVPSPVPAHKIRGRASEHIDVFHRSVTLRLHRALQSGSAAPPTDAPAASGPVFTAKWSAFLVCPSGYDTDDEGGCSEKPSRIEDTPWILVIVGVPGLALVGLTLFLMGPRSWRMHKHCPSWCHGESRESRVKRRELERAQRHTDRQTVEPPATVDGQEAGGQVCGRKLEHDVLTNGGAHDQGDPITPAGDTRDDHAAAGAAAASNDEDRQGEDKHASKGKLGVAAAVAVAGAATAAVVGLATTVMAGLATGAVAAVGAAGTRDHSQNREDSAVQSDIASDALKRQQSCSSVSPPPHAPPEPHAQSNGVEAQKEKRILERQSSSLDFDSTLSDRSPSTARVPHLTPAAAAGGDGGGHHPGSGPGAGGGAGSVPCSPPGVFEQTLDRVSGIGPREHEWSRRLKRELGRTLAIFMFELTGTIVNWWFAAQFIRDTRKDDGTVFSDPLAAAYLAFGILATLGALVNAWSRVVVTRSLVLELRSARRMPVLHSCHNENHVAPAVELAFFERKLHHLKVVGLTLVVESLPFACLGFTKLYRYNSVRSNTLLLVSCAVSAFWVGSKVTRLIGIGGLSNHIERLEREEEEEAMEAKQIRHRAKGGARAGTATATAPQQAATTDAGAKDRSNKTEHGVELAPKADAGGAMQPARSSPPAASSAPEPGDPHLPHSDAAHGDGNERAQMEPEVSRSDSRPRFHEDSTSIAL